MSLDATDFGTIERLRWDIAYLRLWIKFERLRLAFKYNPGQPRVPAGNPDGGQWTSDGSSGTRVAQNTPRGPGSRGGRWTDATPGQSARLAASQSQANAAVQRVRERDPNWRPSPSISSGIEGEIAANEAIAREAQARLSELQRIGIGPGHFAAESIPSTRDQVMASVPPSVEKSIGLDQRQDVIPVEHGILGLSATTSFLIINCQVLGIPQAAHSAYFHNAQPVAFGKAVGSAGIKENNP